MTQYGARDQENYLEIIVKTPNMTQESDDLLDYCKGGFREVIIIGVDFNNNPVVVGTPDADDTLELLKIAKRAVKNESKR